MWLAPKRIEGDEEDAIAVSHYATAMQHAPNPRVGKRPAPWSSRDIGSFDRLEQIGEGMYGCERAGTFVLTTVRCFF